MAKRKQLVRTRIEAAKLLGVTEKTLGNWKKLPGFPECSSGYDLAKIKLWRTAHSLSSDKESAEARRIRLAIQKEKLRQEKIKADRAERDDEIARGNILPRDEWELFVREIIHLTRDQLISIPTSLCRGIPRKYHAKLRSEGRRRVEKILLEFSRLLERGPAE